MVYRGVCKVLIGLLLIFFADRAFTYTVTLVDKRGRQVVIDVPLKRAIIVITYELIPALNIWEQVVGVSKWAEEACGLYRAIVAENPSFKRPAVGGGGDVNVETILKLNPDLVITWTYNLESIRFLEEKGIKVFAIYPESLSELYKDMRIHGRLFGKEKRVEEVIAQMTSLFDLISERLSSIEPERRQRVIHLGSVPTRVSGAFGVTNDMVKIAGGINLGEKVKARHIDVSVEKILEWNPDVIFIWGSARYDESLLYSSGQWKFVKAVKNNRVYKLPKWSTWSPRLAPVVLYMATRLYPEAFRDINFERLADEFYKKVFGISYLKVKKYEGF